MFDLPKFIEYLNSFGLLGLLAFLGFALYKKWIVMGYQLDDAKAELREIKDERNELLRFHFRGMKIFSKALTGRELSPKPGIIPEQGEEE